LKKIAVLVCALLLGPQASPANAEAPIFIANSIEDRKQPAGMSYRYAMKGISTYILDTKPGELVVKVNFAGAVNSTSFMQYGSSLPMMRVKILTTGGQKDDTGFIWLDAPRDTPYQGKTPILAVASYYSDGKSGVPQGRQSLAKCASKTWMDGTDSSDWVAFSIDMNCADIPTTISVTAFLDSDIYSPATYADSKYSPEAPLYLDLRQVPRPPKMKEQVVAFTNTIPQQKMENPQISVNINSTSGFPLLTSSLTPTVCIPAMNAFTMQIQLNAPGTCTVEVYSNGTATHNPSNRARMSFYVAPYVMQSQEIYWDEPYDVVVGDEDFDLFIYTSAKLPITVFSQSPEVCQFRDSSNPSMVTIVGAGYCRLSVNQVGNDRYYSRSATASFLVEKAPVVTATSKPKPPVDRSKSSADKKAPPKKFSASTTSDKQQDIEVKKGTAALSKKGAKEETIKCTKGPIVKPVKGVNPKCPTGWKLKK
jgi:hypothetical protein